MGDGERKVQGELLPLPTPFVLFQSSQMAAIRVEGHLSSYLGVA